MQSLQQKASEWSGVAASDAFAIDETNLFETLGGLQPFVDLSTNFYTRSQIPNPFLSLSFCLLILIVELIGGFGFLKIF